MNNENIVYLVHCVDTEGPLYESLDATMERLKDLFGVEGIAPTRENLRKIRNAELDLGGNEQEIALAFGGHLLNYNDTWDKIDDMLDTIMSGEFRNRLHDSSGNGWVYNWHCLDHVGYENNPRRRDIGYHNIFDHYRHVLKNQQDCPDAIHWHFHPMSVYRDAHRCATSYVNSTELHQILCRRIIERQWFPTVYRAGFQAERPDSHLFLEQWIPFDISNMALDDNTELDQTIDFRNGRSADWRLAPADWSIYQPHHDNYQMSGSCRRWIARGLNILNRIASVDQAEMDKAFKRAADGQPALVGVVSHDFRNIEPEVDFVRNLIETSQKKYPDVKFKFCEAIDAFRHIIWPEGIQESPLELDLKYHSASQNDVPNIEVNTITGKVFGPQPFLAIQTKSRRFIHDNFDFSPTQNKWFYAFHADTLPIEDVKSIGVAANDRFGNSWVKTIDINT